MITGVTITNPGSGSTAAPTVTFGGTHTLGRTATGTATITRSVKSVTVTNGGTGYSSAPTVTFTGGGGSGAAATVQIVRTVNSLTLTAEGSGYSSDPTVASRWRRHRCRGKRDDSGGRSFVSLNTPGSGYHTAPTVSSRRRRQRGGGNAALSGGTLTLQALGDQQVNNNAYSGPSANTGPFNLKNHHPPLWLWHLHRAPRRERAAMAPA